MYKLLIVDDEPLVQVGIKSMLNWAELDIELCGIAMNGKAALEIIEQQLPDIVITDIKMPIMSGLELIRICRERYGSEHPAFIILTSYEDFQMAKEALRYQVTDYLVKIELTAKSLRAAVERVLEQAGKQQKQKNAGESYINMQALYDKFFIRLLNNLFDSQEQFRLQSRDLNLSFSSPGYVCSYLEILSVQKESDSSCISQISLQPNKETNLRADFTITPPLRHSTAETGENNPASFPAGLKAASQTDSGADSKADSQAVFRENPDLAPRETSALMSLEKQASLFNSALQMLREILVKYTPCHIVSLDLKHCAVIFCCREGELAPDWAAGLKPILETVSATLRKYYNVSLKGGIGSVVFSPLAVSESYQYARQAAMYTAPGQPILYIEDCGEASAHSSLFNISLFKDALSRAFEELDADALCSTLDEIISLFCSHPGHFVQALDGACNILYLSISLLPGGEELITKIFEDYPDNYRSIYRQTTVEQITDWLSAFKDRLCEQFLERRREHKNHIVTNVKRYLSDNITQRLTLNEVAAVFGISPNYLSQLFKKYNDMGFSEYITFLKIREAKTLLCDSTYKVYEIADMLGFESAFYFSKVFKKVEGISPTEYQNQKVL